jgi:hypothetical protein
LPVWPLSPRTGNWMKIRPLTETKQNKFNNARHLIFGFNCDISKPYWINLS